MKACIGDIVGPRPSDRLGLWPRVRLRLLLAAFQVVVVSLVDSHDAVAAGCPRPDPPAHSDGR